MSLMSVREKLNNAALEDGASKEDLLRAALAASNDRYEKAVQEQNARLDRLEAAVRASNEQRAIDGIRCIHQGDGRSNGEIERCAQEKGA